MSGLYERSTLQRPCQTCDTKRFSCVAKPGCCTSDLGCSGGRCWTDSKTKQGTCGPQCRGDQDCSSKEECVKGSCRERCLCTKDADCSASTRCANCRCIERTCSDDHPQSPATTAKDETLTTAVSKIKGCLGAGQGKLTIVAVCSRPGAYKERGLLSKNLRWIRAGLRKVKRLHKRTSFLLVCPKKASHKLWTAHGHLAGKISWKQAP